MEETSDFNGH